MPIVLQMKDALDKAIQNSSLADMYKYYGSSKDTSTVYNDAVRMIERFYKAALDENFPLNIDGKLLISKAYSELKETVPPQYQTFLQILRGMTNEYKENNRHNKNLAPFIESIMLINFVSAIELYLQDTA